MGQAKYSFGHFIWITLYRKVKGIVWASVLGSSRPTLVCGSLTFIPKHSMSDISSISASTDPGESSNASEDESFDDDVGCDPEDIVEDGELEGENGDDDDDDDDVDLQGLNL